MATILVADDESPIVDLLRDLLKDDGHTVLTAYDGRQALAVARAEHPDLLLSDVMMPLMDGVRLAHLLRADPATRDLIIILMSAARPPDLQTVGAVAFLTKPFDLDAVSRLIARSLASEP